MSETVLEKVKDEDVTIVNDEDVAMVNGDEDEDTQANRYMLFNIGNEIYGIAIQFVTEIIELQKVTAVPNMPSYIKGVINLRGKVIPVLDIRLRFKMDGREYDDRTCIIIVNINKMTIGFVVDTVAEVQDIPSESIEPPPTFSDSTTNCQYISGLGKIDDNVKIILDVEKLITQDDWQITNKNQNT